MGVLSSCSPIFKSIIDDLPTNDSVIYLRGVQHDELESILQFIYLGSTTFDEKKVNTSTVSTEEPMEEDSIFLVPPKDSIFKLDKMKQFNEKSSETEKAAENETIPDEQSSEEEKKKTATQSSNDVKKKQDSVNTNSKIPCNKCDMQFSQVSDLGLHIRKNHSGKQVVGTLMKKKQKEEKSIKKLEENKSKMKFVSSNTNMNLEKKVLKLESISFSCNQCEYVGNSPGNLKLHIRRDHEGGKTFKIQNTQVNTEQKENKFPCEKCDFQSAVQSDLKQHIQTNHEVKIKAIHPRQLTPNFQGQQEGIMYMFPCNQCDFQTASSETLRSHIQNKHETEKFKLTQVEAHNERLLAVSFDS